MTQQTSRRHDRLEAPDEQPTFRPKYVSFDCYGTLISCQMTPILKDLVGDQTPAEQWDRFVAEFRAEVASSSRTRQR